MEVYPELRCPILWIVCCQPLEEYRRADNVKLKTRGTVDEPMSNSYLPYSNRLNFILRFEVNVLLYLGRDYVLVRTEFLTRSLSHRKWVNQFYPRSLWAKPRIGSIFISRDPSRGSSRGFVGEFMNSHVGHVGFDSGFNDPHVNQPGYYTRTRDPYTGSGSRRKEHMRFMWSNYRVHREVLSNFRRSIYQRTRSLFTI